MDRLNCWMRVTAATTTVPGAEQLQYTNLDGSEEYDVVEPRGPLGAYTYAFAYKAA